MLSRRAQLLLLIPMMFQLVTVELVNGRFVSVKGTGGGRAVARTEAEDHGTPMDRVAVAVTVTTATTGDGPSSPVARAPRRTPPVVPRPQEERAGDLAARAGPFRPPIS